MSLLKIAPQYKDQIMSTEMVDVINDDEEEDYEWVFTWKTDEEN